MHAPKYSAEKAKYHYSRLIRYHERVNAPGYGKRKRGNPPDVLKAVEYFKRGKRCSKCGSTNNVHLHHLNGEWRDYRLSNLEFFCRDCHLAKHHGSWNTSPKQGVMSMTRMDWTSNNMHNARKLVELVESDRYSDKTVRETCLHISTESRKIFGMHLDRYLLERCYYKYGNRVKYGSSNVEGNEKKFVAYNHQMTIKEAIEFHSFIKNTGIIIVG